MKIWTGRQRYPPIKLLAHSIAMKNLTYDDSQEHYSLNGTDGGEAEYIDPGLYWTISAFITAIGVTGNCIILVLFSTKRYSRISYSVYVRALAVSDSLVLISILTDEAITKMLGRDILYGNRDICFVVLIWIFFFQVLSSAFVLAITVDRYIAVVYPLRRASLCTFSRAIWVTVGLIIGCFVLCLPAPIWKEIETAYQLESQEISDDDFICRMRGSLGLNIFGTLSLFLFILILPFCIVLVLNFRSVNAIRSTWKKQIELGRTMTISNSQIRVTLSLIAVTIASVLVLLPILVAEIMLIISRITESESLPIKIIDRAWVICNVIQRINYGQNCYVLLVFGREYRFALKKLLCRSSISENSGLSVVPSGGQTVTSRI